MKEVLGKPQVQVVDGSASSDIGQSGTPKWYNRVEQFGSHLIFLALGLTCIHVRNGGR